MLSENSILSQKSTSTIEANTPETIRLKLIPWWFDFDMLETYSNFDYLSHDEVEQLWRDRTPLSNAASHFD